MYLQLSPVALFPNNLQNTLLGQFNGSVAPVVPNNQFSSILKLNLCILYGLSNDLVRCTFFNIFTSPRSSQSKSAVVLITKALAATAAGFF